MRRWGIADGTDTADGLDLDRALDVLFSTAPDEFVAARNALVRSLRAAKRREEATSVAALRKPPRAVWAVNQLALSGDPAFAHLVAAVGMARAATRDSFRDVIVVMRDALMAATAAAVSKMGVTRADDHGEVEVALQKVVGDADAFDELVVGRLVAVPEGGIGALGAMPAEARGGDVPRSTKVARARLPRASVPKASAPPKAATAPPEPTAPTPKPTKGASLERRRADKELARAAATTRRAAEAVAVADADDGEARHEVASAEAAVDDAERALEGARLHFNQALDDAQAAHAKLAAAASALAEAQAAEAVAQATLDALP